MPPSKQLPCQVCKAHESKYTCSKCAIQYCSVPCYKQHKESACSASADIIQGSSAEVARPGNEPLAAQDPERERPHAPGGPSRDPSGVDVKPPSPPLRPLTSLNWPYVPEESAYPDPLKRDDPKPLQLYQYEAIATSPAVRKALGANARLPELLRSIDGLRGEDREEALQRALGVSASDANPSLRSVSSAQSDEDVKALRDLAEAIEMAVRGDKQGALGLDWGD